MSNITVCVRFRPLSLREKKVHDDSICVKVMDAESFIFKAEKEEELVFCFDRVFYQDSEQADVYEFLAMPIVQDTINAINGTIITYGQTGAGKTYSMEGPNILDCDGHKKGLLPRIVAGIFEYIKSAKEMTKYTVKLSMVEIYMEKVRDLFNLSKDNLQIKEGKAQGIFLSGATEIPILDPEEALKCLSHGIANRAVGETQMNMASSRSHCVYIFLIHQQSVGDDRLRTGKLVLVDLAGSEKVEKTCAEGRILEEAKTINKSLSALGNVINALTTGKVNHIPYRDSKLTRILQDALGGNSRTALLCCCSPSSLNTSESLSTLRFGTRTKLIKAPLRIHTDEDKGQMLQHPIYQAPNNSSDRELDDVYDESHVMLCRTKFIEAPLRIHTDEDKGQMLQLPIYQALNSSSDRVLDNLRGTLNPEDVKLLEELFILEGIFFEPQSAEDLQTAYEDVVSQTISSLQQMVEDLRDALEEVSRNSETGASRGCGHVTMGSFLEAKAAMSALDKSDLGGREMCVKFSTDMESGRKNIESLNTTPRKDIVFESPHKVYVGNLSWSVKPEDLRDHFSQFGTVVSTRLLRDKKTGKHRVYGFLSFSSAEELQAATSSSGTEFRGRTLLVREIINRE